MRRITHWPPLEDGHHKSMLAGSNVQPNLTTTYEWLMRYTRPHMGLTHVHQRCYPEHIWRRRWTWKDGLARPPVSSVLSVLKRLEDSGLLTLKRVQVSSGDVVEVTTQLPVWAHGPWGTCVRSRRHNKKSYQKKKRVAWRDRTKRLRRDHRAHLDEMLGATTAKTRKPSSKLALGAVICQFHPPPADPTKDGTSCVCHLKVAHAHERWRGESKNCFLNESKLIAKDHFYLFFDENFVNCHSSLKKSTWKYCVRSRKSHLLDPALKQASCKYLASSGQESNLFLVNMRFYWKVHHKLLLCCINGQFHVLLIYTFVYHQLHHLIGGLFLVLVTIISFRLVFIHFRVTFTLLHMLQMVTLFHKKGVCLKRLNNAHFRFVSFVPLCLKIFVNALLKWLDILIWQGTIKSQKKRYLTTS